MALVRESEGRKIGEGQRGGLILFASRQESVRGGGSGRRARWQETATRRRRHVQVLQEEDGDFANNPLAVFPFQLQLGPFSVSFIFF